MKKRVISLFLILAMTVTVCACGKKEEKKDEDTVIEDTFVEDTVDKDVQVGDSLGVPEKVMELDEFYVRIMFPGEKEYEFSTYNFTMVNTDDAEESVMYLAEGEDLIYSEVITTEDRKGNITQYYKDQFMNEFMMVPYETEAEAEQAVVEMLQCAMTVGWCCAENEDVKYVKCEDANDSNFGEVWVYDRVISGEKYSRIYVDKDTGLWIKEEMDGETVFEVTKFSQTDINIPDYK